MAEELYRFTIAGHHTSEYWENDLYFLGENLTAGDVIHNAKDLIAAWLNSPHASYLDLLPSSVEVDRLSAIRAVPANGIAIVSQFQLGSNPGTVAGGASSWQLCPIIRLIPPLGVKSAGRFFLPAVAESDIANNVLGSGWVTRANALMNTLVGGFDNGTGITWTQAIYSRKLSQYHKAVSFDSSPIIGWQTRRTRPKT